MTTSEPGRCSQCDSELEPGYLGLASGLFWATQQIVGWRSFIPVALRNGRFVVGSLLSTPWLQTRSAHRCPECGILVIPSDR